MKPWLQLFILVIKIFSASSLACYDSLVTSTSYTCSYGAFTSTSLPNMPSNLKNILITGEVQFSSFCSASEPYHYAALTIEPVSGTVINLIDVTWAPTTKTMKFNTQDSSAVKQGANSPCSTAQAATQWYTWTVFVNMANTGATAAGGFFAQSGATTSVTNTGDTTLSYTSTWTLNASPQIYLCSGPGGANPLTCNMKNVKVYYSTFSSGTVFRDGTIPTLIASYKMFQNSGYAITDSASSLGTAYLGESSSNTTPDSTAANLPVWLDAIDSSTQLPNQDQGLKFSLGTEYVKLPYFALAASTQISALSFTVKTWVKLPASVTADGYIFTYNDAGPTNVIFGVKLLYATLKLQYVTYDKSTTTAQVSQVLQLSKWNSITASFTYQSYYYTASPYGVYIVGKVNGVEDGRVILRPTTAYSANSLNKIRIGGPPTVTGTIAGFEIYSPGTAFTTDQCESTTCSLSLGLMNPATCIFPKCSTNCQTCSSTLSTGCMACDTGYGVCQGQCVYLTCGVGKYFRTATCQCENCIVGCDVCGDSTTCTTCNSAFVKQGSVCNCPTGKYLTGTSCSDCIVGCDVCGDSSTCTTCNSAFVKQGTVCNCPTGKYLTGTSCSNCIVGCDLCGDSSTCTTCNSAFVKQGSVCNCPTGKYLTGTSCSNCIVGCDVCGDSSTCTTCNSAFVKQGTVCNCPTGKYLTGTSCSNCIVGCDLCGDSSTCTTCNSAFVKQGSVCNCPTGQYLKNGACSPCIRGCDVCSDDTTCTTCNSAFVKQGTICVCPTGQYWDGAACANCISGCDVCGDSSTCTTCNSAFVKQGTTCACSTGKYVVTGPPDTCSLCSVLDTHCTQCSDANTCTACSQGYITSGGKTCTACLSSQYATGSSCTACSTLDASCLECSDANTCTKCSQGKTPSGKTCACTSSQYFSTPLSACTACSTLDTKCTACSDENTCTGCSQGYIPSGKSCISCGSSQYSSGSKCFDCPESCDTCTGASSCQSCKPGYSLSGSICVPSTDSSSDKPLILGLALGIPLGLSFLFLLILLSYRLFISWRKKRRTRNITPDSLTPIKPSQRSPLPETSHIESSKEEKIAITRNEEF